MIVTKEYPNMGSKFYVAEATAMKKMATGSTRESALKNLKWVIRNKIKGLDLFAPTVK